MKILFISPHFPYSQVPHAGGKTIYNLVKSLNKRGHEIDLVSMVSNDELGYIEEVKNICSSLHVISSNENIFNKIKRWSKVLFTYRIDIKKRYFFRLYKKVKELINMKKYDIIQVEHTLTANYLPEFGCSLSVLDMHDVISKPACRKCLLARNLFSRFLLKKKWQKIAGDELNICKKFDLLLTRSEYDKEDLLNQDSNLKIEVLPPWVDFNHEVLKEKPSHQKILFVGAMNRDVNIKAVIYFCEKILPRVRRILPEIKFYIVGNAPPPEIKVLEKKYKNIVVTGFVEKLDSYYLDASVFVAPFFIGGGIIVKILESMSFGLPVVSTSIGNEGIQATPNKEILIADNPEDFSKKIILLLSDTSFWQIISENGKNFVYEKYTWGKVVQRLELLYGSFLGYKVI